PRGGDVARIDGEGAREVADPGPGEYLRLDQRRYREPLRAVLELLASELHTLVRLGVWPECDAESLGAIGHPADVALDDVEVEEQRRCLDVVHLSHHVKLCLPAQHPPYLSVRTEGRVLLLRRPDRLIPPLGDGGGCLELDREPAVRDQAHVPAS